MRKSQLWTCFFKRLICRKDYGRPEQFKKGLQLLLQNPGRWDIISKFNWHSNYWPRSKPPLLEKTSNFYILNDVSDSRMIRMMFDFSQTYFGLTGWKNSDKQFFNGFQNLNRVKLSGRFTLISILESGNESKRRVKEAATFKVIRNKDRSFL